MVYQPSNIFRRIIDKELPSNIVYEDEHFLAILDVNPKQLGHTLILPKALSKDVFDTKPEVLSKINEIAIIVSNKIKNALHATGFKWQFNSGKSAGQEVFHLHMHVIPYYEEFRAPRVTQDLADDIFKASPNL